MPVDDEVKITISTIIALLILLAIGFIFGYLYAQHRCLEKYF